MLSDLWCHCVMCIEDKEDLVPKKTVAKTGASSNKWRQPPAKRRRKNSTKSADNPKETVTSRGATLSQEVAHSLTGGANLSASSSSSEDEFDRIVKNWNEDTSSLNNVAKELTSTRRGKRTRK